MDGKNGKDGLNGKDGSPGKAVQRNWKECAWMNVDDDKDKGLVKVQLLFQ